MLALGLVLVAGPGIVVKPFGQGRRMARTNTYLNFMGKTEEAFAFKK